MVHLYVVRLSSGRWAKMKLSDAQDKPANTADISHSLGRCPPPAAFLAKDSHQEHPQLPAMAISQVM